MRGIVLEPLASSYAVLTPDERQLGCALIDIGGGTTDFAVFFRGGISHTAVVPLGGDSVTGDIAVGLEIPVAKAEELKCGSGCALAVTVGDDEFVEVARPGGGGAQRVPHGFLAEVIEARMEEIFLLLHRELVLAGCADLLAGGVILTGGGALLDRVAELAQSVFRRSVRVAAPSGVSLPSEDLASPIYATGVGLVLYGLEALKAEARQGRARRGWAGRLSAWCHDFF